MEYIFLKREWEILKRIVSETEERMARATEAKAKSGSEQDGWHDEIFRVLLCEEQVWNTRLSELKGILHCARVIEPREQKEAVAIGNGVKIKYKDGGEIFEFIVDGYLARSYEHRVSFQSPIAQGLIGAKKGEERTLTIGDRKIIVMVIDILSPSEAEKIIPQD